MGGVDKLLFPLAGRPLLVHCLDSFDSSPLVQSISIAASDRNISVVRCLVEQSGLDSVVAVVEGGARRQDSVARALVELEAVDIVLVHDGARPFVDSEIVRSAVLSAKEFGAATAAVPVKDTIKVAADDLTVSATPLRDTLWAAQTPQAFSAGLLRTAHRCVWQDVTDDAAMVEATGHPVKLFMGSYENIKVTTPGDLVIAEAIAQSRRNSAEW